MGHKVNLFRAKEQADLLGENIGSVRYGPKRIGRRCLDMKTGERLLKMVSHSIKVLERPQPVESEKTWHKNDVHRAHRILRRPSSYNDTVFMGESIVVEEGRLSGFADAASGEPASGVALAPSSKSSASPPSNRI